MAAFVHLLERSLESDAATSVEFLEVHAGVEAGSFSA